MRWLVSAEARWLCLVLLVGLGLSAGCSDPNTNPYGAVELYSRSSLNGLGAHKKLWEQAGAKCIYPKRLSSRLDSVDVIVLVAQDFDAPGKRARQWLEEWLRAQPGRTVVYFGRDFNAELFYLQKTIGAVPPEHLPQVRQRLAQVKAAEIQERLESYSESTYCGWFYIDTRQRSTEVAEFSGPWAGQLEAHDSTWPLRTRLMPPARSYRSTPPSWIVNPPQNTSSTNPISAVPNANGTSAGKRAEEEKIVFRSEWQADELKTQSQWDAEFSDIFDSQVLLESAENDPLVFRLEDRQGLGEGKIVVVANGAPFLNGTIVEPFFGQIAELVIKECLPAKRVAFLAYDNSGLQISLTDEIDHRGVGIEMLVEWPLSAVTLPACLLGLITCIYLLPILGRPRALQSRSVSDFGMHVEAMGQLLRDAGDHSYAKRTIADYFIKVRNEPPPAWLNPSQESTDSSP